MNVRATCLILLVWGLWLSPAGANAQALMLDDDESALGFTFGAATAENIGSINGSLIYSPDSRVDLMVFGGRFWTERNEHVDVVGAGVGLLPLRQRSPGEPFTLELGAQVSNTNDQQDLTVLTLSALGYFGVPPDLSSEPRLVHFFGPAFTFRFQAGNSGFPHYREPGEEWYFGWTGGLMVYFHVSDHQLVCLRGSFTTGNGNTAAGLGLGLAFPWINGRR